MSRRQADTSSGVQPVEQAAYDAIVSLGDRGGWESLISAKAKSAPVIPAKPAQVAKGDAPRPNGVKGKRKSVGAGNGETETQPTRRSKRNR